MLYIHGSRGTALVRIAVNPRTDKITCVILNNGTVVVIDRSTDALFLTGLQALETAIGVVSGPPTIVSDISELV